MSVGGLLSEGTQGLSLLPTVFLTSLGLFVDGMQLGEVERTWRRHIHPPESSRLELAQTTSTLPGGISDLLFMHAHWVVIFTIKSLIAGDIFSPLKTPRLPSTHWPGLYF